MIYLEAGSGAARPIPENMIRSVKENIKIPIAVGGGLRTGKEIKETYSAGADLIIIGNGVERDPNLLIDACKIRDSFKSLPPIPHGGT